MSGTRQTGSGQWATFTLGDERFALEVECVQEVLMEQPLTPVPRAPAHIVGLLNLRGQIISAIDLRKCLHFPLRAPGKVTRVLVVSTGETPFGLVVDDIDDVLDLPSDLWRPVPDTLDARHRPFVRGICPVEGRMVLWLDLASFNDDVIAGVS